MPTPPISDAKRKEARKLRKQNVPLREIAERLKMSTGTVSNCTRDVWRERLAVRREEIEVAIRKGWSFARLTAEFKIGAKTIKRIVTGMAVLDKTPAVAKYGKIDEFNLPPLPPSDAKALTRFMIDTKGHWGVIGDIHIPYHDTVTIERFVEECRKRDVAGILLNGDTLDSHEVAFFDVERSAKSYREELELTKQFLSYLRARFPDIRIVWKDGNHEERAGRYCLRRAPAISDLPCVNLPQFVDMAKYGIEYVTDKRIIMLGQLPVIHGHEYRGGISMPVNAARGIFLKAKDTVMVNHFHQTSMHPETTIKDKEIMVWSVGCACGLQPRYNPHGGKWNHGFAMVELDADGGFAVDNRRVLRSGKVV